MIQEWFLIADISELTGMSKKQIGNFIDNNALEYKKDENGHRLARLKDILQIALKEVTTGKDESKSLAIEEKRLDVALKRQKLKTEQAAICAEERNSYRMIVSQFLQPLRDAFAEFKGNQEVAEQITKAIEDCQKKFEETVEIYED